MMKTTSHLNFDVPTALSDENYKHLIGLSREQFADLLLHLQRMRSTESRSLRTCLGVFLTKLRTGLPNTILSSIFSLSIFQIQKITSSVRDCLMETFVPACLGFQHISHQSFCENHTTPIARALFTSNDVEKNEAVLVLDGTYVYIQKSSDYNFQRRCYSLHKNRPLVKPMMIVGTDGYILSVIGPYMSDYYNNDAKIVQHMFKNNIEDMKEWLQENDVLVVDRGFRDSVEFLEEGGFRVQMPTYLQKGQKQHTTQKANLSRLVTKVRWVVESANGRIKQWKLLDKVIPNTIIPHIGDLVRIVCALCNKYRPAIASMNQESEKVAYKMLEKVNASNRLQQIVEENNLLRKKVAYQSIESLDLVDFSKLSVDDLRDITLGVYQINQSMAYTKEHMKDDGSYELLLCKDFPNLLRVKIQSRHSKNTVHTLWIQYSNDSTGAEAITGWYCTCKVGARVVGCCSHIASVLWFMGYQRYLDTDTSIDQRKRNIQDAAEIPGDTDDEVEE